MSKAYETEVKAIEMLRLKYPKEKQSKFAKQIKKREFTNDADSLALAETACKLGRPLLSIYSVIRRYDARVKAASKSAMKKSA